ncbi:MAG: acetylornithine transaminase [Syntrophales bacterium]|nr:acetylornithine transaminase [Syntrophales bacterium]
MTNEEIISLASKYLINTYNRFPIALARGEGMRVWDLDGNEYLDFVGGIAVCSLGHCHPLVTEAIKSQAEKLIHVSNLYYIEAQVIYAAQLVEKTFGQKVFFCNSGAEANEAAIKLARRFGKMNGNSERYEIITMVNSFHGRTMATITATGQDKVKKGFEPLVPGFKSVPFNDAKALEAAIDERTCAVMLEPIQAEGGVRVPTVDYLEKVREICNRHHLLLILDEVQTGMGRTGKLFAYEHYGIKPDVMTLAKALGNGFPIGAVVTTEGVAQCFEPGSHASTFGGNPLAMAAAQVVLETVSAEPFLREVEAKGEYLMDRLAELARVYNVIKEVRGKGLICGMELSVDASSVALACLKRGLLLATAGPSVLRFLPPLIVTRADIDEAVEKISQVLGEL